MKEHYQIQATVSARQLLVMVVEVVNDEDFDHRYWAVSHAELLEELARKIREGYAREKEES